MAEIPAKLRKQRRQLEIQVAHEPGAVRETRFQAPSNGPNGTKLDGLIILNREGSNKFIYLIRSLDPIPVGSGDTSGFDDGLRRQGKPCRMDCREGQRGRQHWRRCIHGWTTLVSGDRPMCDLCRAKGNRIGSKFRSFESFRSNRKSPEVLTFDELAERSRWSVELAERQEEAEAEFPDFPL